MAIAGNLSVALSLNSARFRQGLDRARRQTETFTQRLNRNLRGVTRGFSGLTSAVAGLGAVLGTRELLANADQLVKNADAAGIAFEAYQMLQFGFEQSGISAEAFSRAATNVGRALLNAERGLNTSIRQFEELGLNIDDLLRLNPEQRFLAVVRAISEIEDPAERSARAAELLGRQFGNVAINIDNVVEAGAGLTPINEMAARSAEMVNDAMNRLGTAFQNLTTNILAPFLARFVPFVESMSQFAGEHPRITQLGIAITALGASLALLGGPITVVSGAIVLLVTNLDRLRMATANLLNSSGFLREFFVDLGRILNLVDAEDREGAIERLTNNVMAVAMGLDDVSTTATDVASTVMQATTAISDLGDEAESVATNQLSSFEATLQNAMDTASRISEVGSRVFDGLADGLTEFVTTGMFNFANFARSIIQDLIRIQIRAGLVRLFQGGGLFAGFFQQGGRIPSGQVGLVGEAGPEFVRGPAQVTSAVDTANILSSSGGSNVTLNITTFDSQSFDDYITSPRARESIAAAMDINNRDRGF